MTESTPQPPQETRSAVNPYDLTPPFVLPWADNILAADQDTALGDSSRKALQDLERAADEHDPALSRAGEYFMKLRLLANGLASKISQERQLLATREEGARIARDGGFTKAARAKALAGLRRGGLKLFFFGGFFASLIYQYIGVDFGPNSTQNPGENLLTALVVTTGLGMLGSYGFGFYEEYNNNRHNTQYDQEIQNAQRDYHRAVGDHSENTLRAAAHLWEEFTAQPYDIEREIQAQLLLPALRALIGNENLEAEMVLTADKPLHDAIEQAQQALKDVLVSAKPLASRLLRRQKR